MLVKVTDDQKITVSGFLRQLIEEKLNQGVEKNIVYEDIIMEIIVEDEIRVTGRFARYVDRLS